MNQHQRDKVFCDLLATGASALSAALLTVNSLIATPVRAGILRHDVPRDEFVALGAQPAFRSVVAITRARSGQSTASVIGSAVLVAPRWVLTAAHVVDALDSASYRVTLDGDTVLIDSLVRHPQYHATKDSLYVDLALLHLVRALPREAVASLSTRRVTSGTAIVSVGYGRMAAANDPSATNSGSRHAFQNVIDTLGAGNAPRSFIGSDLDHPMDSTMSTTGSPQAMSLEGNINGGDSGGGLFVSDAGRWRLAGIAAMSSYDRERLEAFSRFGFYGSLSFWTRLDNQLSWIRSIARAR